MSRIYTVVFEGVSVAAAQDLFQLLGATGKVIRLRRVVLSATDTTAPTSQMLEVRVRYLPATVTNGSGGTTPTPQATSPGDSAASFTAKANNTTPATTNGTAVKIFEGGCHVFNGLDENFGDDGTGQHCPEAGPSTSLTVELLGAPTGTVHLSGTAWVEEIG